MSGLVRKRKQMAIALMAGTIVLGIVLTIVLGTDIVPIYLVGIPMSFVLMWLTASVTRADERGAQWEDPPAPTSRTADVDPVHGASTPRADEPIVVF